MSFLLTTRQNRIMNYILTHISAAKEIETLDVGFEGEDKKRYKFIHYEVKLIEDTFSVLFNLPVCSNMVLFCLTKNNPLDTSNILANIEDYQQENEIFVGETITLTNSSLIENFNYLLLRTETSFDLKGIPDKETIGDELIRFCLVVPLTQNELMHKNKNGHDALIDLFVSTNKSLFFKKNEN
jgi:Suppressor of fused protein (SUFU)